MSAHSAHRWYPYPGSDRLLALLLVAVAAIAIPSIAPAQTAEEQPAAATTPTAGEPEAPDPTSPAGAVQTYLDLCREGSYEEAADYLNLDRVAEKRRADGGVALARQLKAVLDQKLWVDLAQLSRDPAGDPEDGLPRGVDRVGTIRDTPLGDVGILIEREPGTGDQRTWRISASTVAAVPALYREYGYGLLGELLPEWMFRVRLGEAELWQWFGLLLAALCGLLLAWIAVRILVWILRSVTRRTATEFDDQMLTVLPGPSRLLMAVLFFAVLTLPLRLSVPMRAFSAGSSGASPSRR